MNKITQVTRGVKMISFKPLEITLIEQGMLKKDFIKRAGIGSSTFQKMMSGQHVNTSTLEKACKCLGVPVEKIISID